MAAASLWKRASVGLRRAAASANAAISQSPDTAPKMPLACSRSASTTWSTAARAWVNASWIESGRVDDCPIGAQGQAPIALERRPSNIRTSDNCAEFKGEVSSRGMRMAHQTDAEAAATTTAVASMIRTACPCAAALLDHSRKAQRCSGSSASLSDMTSATASRHLGQLAMCC
jgi:hypothetical protein